MNSKKIRVTKKQLERLLSDIRDAPTEEASETGMLIDLHALDLTLRRAAMAPAPERNAEVVIDSSKLGCTLTEDEDGNMTFRFGSRDLSLEGKVLRFMAGEICKKVSLRRVDAEQVGALIVLTSAERAGLPEGARPRVDLVSGVEPTS